MSVSTMLSKNYDCVYEQFHDLLEDDVVCRHEFEKQWKAKGPRSLLDFRVNSDNETMLHLVCRKDNVILARILLNYRLFLQLINLKSSNDDNDKTAEEGEEELKQEEFRKFVYTPTISSGETALYQCLKRLVETKRSGGCQNKQLKAILKNFIKSDLGLNTNVYINKRAAYKTTIFHLLVESEQLDLVKYFIWFFLHSFGNSKCDAIDYSKTDFLQRTPLMIALETGNKEIAKLLFKETKLRIDEGTRVLEYLDGLNDVVDDDEKEENNNSNSSNNNNNISQYVNLKKTLMRNKCVSVSSSCPVKNLSLVKNQCTIEIDCGVGIWLDYLILANRYKISISSTSCFASNLQKQIFINRVNKSISDQYTLVTIVLVNYSSSSCCSDQLKNFIRFLPYNFKIVVVFDDTPRPLNFLDWHINCASFNWQEEEEEEKGQKEQKEQKSDSIENFIHHDLKRLHEYVCQSNVSLIAEAIKLFKHAQKFEHQQHLNDKLMLPQFYDKMGDFYACFCNNFEMAAFYYKKALENNNNSTNETRATNNMLLFAVRVLIKLADLYLICDKKELAFENFSDAYKICKPMLTMLDNNKSTGLDNCNTTKYKIDDTKIDDCVDKHRAIVACQESIVEKVNFYKDNYHVDIARELNNIGSLYNDLCDWKSARKYYMRALDMYEQIYKCDHGDCAMILNNIGICEWSDMMIIGSSSKVKFLTHAHQMYLRLATTMATTMNEKINYMEGVAKTAVNTILAFYDIEQLKKDFDNDTDNVYYY